MCLEWGVLISANSDFIATCQYLSRPFFHFFFFFEVGKGLDLWGGFLALIAGLLYLHEFSHALANTMHSFWQKVKYLKLMGQQDTQSRCLMHMPGNKSSIPRAHVKMEGEN